MPIKEVFQCAPIQSARAIGMGNQIGSIEAGKFADCILLEKNPLKDIKVMQDRKNILKVVKDGEIVSERGKLLNKDLFS
jgi:imidazolonepropionase-like amidohydrolase